MNSTPNTDTCMFFPFVEFPKLFVSDSFSYVKKAVTVINCISSPVCVVGNILILIAIVAKSSLRTPANVLIGTLALVDFLTGAVVQTMLTVAVNDQHLYRNCIFRDSLFFLGMIFTSASVALMAAVSCERYAALFFHLRYNNLLTNSKAFAIVLVIWMVSLVIALFTAFGDIFLVISQVIVALLWIVSLFAIGVSYSNIVRLVRRHHRQIQSQQVAVSIDTDIDTVPPSQTKLAITMGYVVAISFLFFIPTAIVFQIFTSTKSTSPLIFNSFCLTIAIQFTSSGFNPVFYCWRRPDIRESIVTSWRKVQGLFKVA